MGWYSGQALAAWSGGHWHGEVPDRILGVTQDTRKLVPGQLYVAIRGEVHDGHDFLIGAQEAGAAAALVDAGRVGRIPAGLPCLVVPDTLVGLAALARGYRRELGMQVIGVTGSVGKTTVKELLASMLEAARPTARTLGNWNNQVGLPLSLLAAPRETKVGVFELGMNMAGEIAQLASIAEPDAAVMTPIGPVHMEGFGSEVAIAEEKAALLSALPASGQAVVWQEERFLAVFRHCTAAPLVTVSLCKDADYMLDVVDGGEVRVRERSSGDVERLPCPLPGEHNRLNLLLAVAAARGQGAGWAAIEAGIAAFKPAPMRWERSQIAGVSIINDAYNANPLSMAAALRLFAEEPCRGRRWVVLGGMLELGEMEAEAHEQLGRQVAAGAWAGLVTVGHLGALIADGARSAGFSAARILEVAHPETVGDLLAERVEPGDALLLKGSRGFHLERVVHRLEALIGGDSGRRHKR